MENIQTKKIIWAVGVIVVLVLIAFGVNYWESQANPQADAHPCAINFVQTFVFNVATSTPQSTIARELLTQLLNEYKRVTGCPTLGMTDYSITSIGKPTQVKNDFTIPVSFDIVPLSKSQTVWAIASTTWDGIWIRGERANLGIQKVSTTTLPAYRLVL